MMTSFIDPILYKDSHEIIMFQQCLLKQSLSVKPNNHNTKVFLLLTYK
jgi:hypothetical protein